jgi:hypothetical protein
MDKLVIRKSPTADTRTCDWSKVSADNLIRSSVQHILDVSLGMGLFCDMICRAAVRHDFDKLTNIEQFHADFQTGFKSTIWFDEHRKINRHHLNMPDGVRDDVNLVDVLEHIVDCVMAGMARSGNVYPLSLPDEVLQRAFQNTVSLLLSRVVVLDEGDAKGESA